MKSDHDRSRVPPGPLHGRHVVVRPASLDDAPMLAACGLDLFLLPAARGRSLGPDAARTLARYLVEEAGRTRVTVDPYRWNERAARGWRNAGFRPVEERDADERHLHPWLLMEFDPGV